MRRISLFLTALAISLSLNAQLRYFNPILHKDFSDPDICRVGDDYYLTASSFNYFPGLPILHSRDLVHWNQCGAALLSYDGFSPEDGVRPGCGVWAPAIRHHDGWFYIFAGDPDRGIFMVRSKDPSGRWEDPVWLVRGKGYIDPCPFWDEDGKAYLSHALAGSRAGLKSVVMVAEMDPDGEKLIGPSRVVYDGHDTQPTIEGTKFYKRGGYYYIFAPAGGVTSGWQTVLRSKSPFGPFEERIVLASAEGTVNGPHQGAWVETPSGEDWFLHFQDKGAYGRILHLQPMEWKEDGWPVIGSDPDGDGTGMPIQVGKAPEGFDFVPDTEVAGPYGIPAGWQFPCVPSPTWYMTLPGGGLRLFSVENYKEDPSLWPNFAGRMFPAESFNLTAKLTFRPNHRLEDKGEKGGFAVVGATSAGLILTDTADGIVLDWFNTGGETARVDSFGPSGAKVLWVGLSVRPQTVEGKVYPNAVCRFSYSTDGVNYKSVGDAFAAEPGVWTGARYGFFCNRSTLSNDSGRLDVTDLRVKSIFTPAGDFLYDESKVPDYKLPDVLSFKNGRKVRSVKDWERRREEVFRDIEAEMFGALPGNLPKPRFELRSSEDGVLGGIATRKQVRVHLGEGDYLDLLLYVPAGARGPVPAFLGVNFSGNHTISEDPGIFLPDTLHLRDNFIVQRRGLNSRRWPLETILGRGYAVATFCCEDVWPDTEWYPGLGVGAKYPEAKWGSIAAWGWGLSCALDYLESDPDVDGTKVAVFGHSRLGKTALWAGARDRRFAMVVSNASGCGGAALSRRRFGETVRRINSQFPYWFTVRFRNYDDNEDELPFDQHSLLALIAPRPLYVASGSEDRWADPKGEFLSLSEAGVVYQLYGYDRIQPGEMPDAGGAVEKGLNGYHIRKGPHEILLFDWEHYLDFADRHMK